jgi:hypothetical protein
MDPYRPQINAIQQVPPGFAIPTQQVPPPPPPPAPPPPPPPPPQNQGLVADLCKIIERQSQEIASLVHHRAGTGPAPKNDPRSVSAHGSKMKTKANDTVEYNCEAEVRQPSPASPPLPAPNPPQARPRSLPRRPERKSPLQTPVLFRRAGLRTIDRRRSLGGHESAQLRLRPRGNLGRSHAPLVLDRSPFARTLRARARTKHPRHALLERGG